MITRGGPKVGWLEKRLNRHLFETGDYGVALDKNHGELVELARLASECSPHYDGVTHFGSVGVGVGTRDAEVDGYPLFLKLLLANNRTERPRAEKSCAEMGIDALAKLYYTKTRGNFIVVSMVTWGPSDQTRINDILGTDQYEQCPPCHDCLGRLAVNKAFMPSTEITSVNHLGSNTKELGELVNFMAGVKRPPTTAQLIAA